MTDYDDVFNRAVSAAFEMVPGESPATREDMADAIQAASEVFAADDQERADRLIAETGIASMDIHDGSIRLKLVLANELATKMTDAFKTILDAHPGVENYIEQELTDGETGGRYVFIVCKPRGKTPHALRREAEAEAERLRGQLNLLTGKEVS